MAERKSKRQRFSLGGPAVDASFEDCLTGSTKHVSSDNEEVFDQENRSPEEDTHDTLHSKYLKDQYYIHQDDTESSTVEDTAYLVQARLDLEDAPVAITRLLRVPAILLFQQLSEALFIAFDWDPIRSWYYTLELRTQTCSCQPVNALPNPELEFGTIQDRRPAYYDDPGTLDSRDFRLMDLWSETQAPEYRNLKVFFNEEEYNRSISITFMGVAAKDLRAADLGLRVGPRQHIWCIGGSGASVPDSVAEMARRRWKLSVNRHKWNIHVTNSRLQSVVVRDASWYPDGDSPEPPSSESSSEPESDYEDSEDEEDEEIVD